MAALDNVAVTVDKMTATKNVATDVPNDLPPPELDPSQSADPRRSARVANRTTPVDDVAAAHQEHPPPATQNSSQMLLLDEDNGGGFTKVVKGHGHPTTPLEEATPKPSTTWAPPALVSTFTAPFGEQFESSSDGSPMLSLAGSPTTLPLALKGLAAPALKDSAGLQAIVAASYKLLFGDTTDATPIKFWSILDNGARTLDEAILGIRDELGRHQLALNQQDQGVTHEAIKSAIRPLHQELRQDVQSSFASYTTMTNTHLTVTRDIAKESKDQLEALERRWEAAKQATERAIQLLIKHLDRAIQLLDKHLASIHVLLEDHDT